MIEGEAAPDRYLLQLWPSPRRADIVVRQTSEAAAYWHSELRHGSARCGCESERSALAPGYGTMRGVRGFGDTTALALPGWRRRVPPARSGPSRRWLPPSLPGEQRQGRRPGSRRPRSQLGGDPPGARRRQRRRMDRSQGRGDDGLLRRLRPSLPAGPCRRLHRLRPLLLLHSGSDDTQPAVPLDRHDRPAGRNGGPATFNPPDYNPVYTWKTYPERLQAAGVSSQVYANWEVGDGGGRLRRRLRRQPALALPGLPRRHGLLRSGRPPAGRTGQRASSPWLPDSGLGKNVDHVLAQFTNACRAGHAPPGLVGGGPVQLQRAPRRPSRRRGAPTPRPCCGRCGSNPRLWESTVAAHQLRRERRLLRPCRSA